MIDTSCFGNNFIGIRGECDATAPDSGLYINDLPGISLKLASNLADEDTIRGVQLLRNIEQQAIRQVWVDVKNAMYEYFNIGKIISQKSYGKHYVEDNISYLSPVAANVGIRLRKYNCDDYAGIRVNYVDIRSNSDVAGKVLTITDGCTTKQYNFDAVSCQIVRVQTNYTAITDEVFITVDASDLELQNMTIGNSCNCSRSCRCESGDCVTADGWNGSQSVSQAYGMSVNASCVCDDSQFLCNMRSDLAMLIQTKMGILLAQELMLTKRYNFMVSNSKDDARAMLLFWMGGMDSSSGVEFPSEYNRQLMDVIRGVKSSFSRIVSDCVTCGRIKAIETLP